MGGTLEDMEKPWLKFYEPGVPHHIQYPDIPLYRFLDNAVRDFPEKEAVIFQGRKITYRQLGEEAANVASGLAQRPEEGAAHGHHAPQLPSVYSSLLRGP